VILAIMGGGVNDRATTANIRWSVRLNFEKLVSGAKDWVDSYPDTTADVKDVEDSEDEDNGEDGDEGE
jgi:hypothetical protein